jgi:hypothetical protein
VREAWGALAMSRVCSSTDREKRTGIKAAGTTVTCTFGMVTPAWPRDSGGAVRLGGQWQVIAYRTGPGLGTQNTAGRPECAWTRQGMHNTGALGS